MIKITDSIKSTVFNLEKFLKDSNLDEIFSFKVTVVSLKEDVVNALPKNLRADSYVKASIQVEPDTQQAIKKVVKEISTKFTVAKVNEASKYSTYSNNLVVYIKPTGSSKIKDDKR